MANELRDVALASKAWPFEEARKLLARYPDGAPPKGHVLFETGYGPSGLPHIGTFNEVLRTTMVRRAFALLSDVPTRLVAFSDDLDGLRKVPDNVPQADMLRAHLGKPLTQIPDPFGRFESFAHHNNAMLRDFLDRFGFDYEFLSSTECYRSGRFDPALRLVLRHYDAIMGVMLPTLGEERRATYSPVLPIDPATGVVLQVPVEVVDADAGTIRFTASTGDTITASALGGQAKLQWKVDWAMRWVALGVDYEMAGKDLIDSVVQSSKIARILGAKPPEGFNYEMFLDEQGEKISKSKGNGLSLEQWLTYGPPESLAYFAYREPKRAKQLHMGVIPRAVEDYWKSVVDYPGQTPAQQLANPVHHLPFDRPAAPPAVSFGLLLNLAGLPGVGTRETMWGFLRRYDPALSPEGHPDLDRLVDYAVAYARDFVAPTLQRRAPTAEEADALRALDAALAADQPVAGEDAAARLQNHVYDVGKRFYGKERLRDWFQILYETLLGSAQGPRMGSFISLYGIENTRALIADALARAAGIESAR